MHIEISKYSKTYKTYKTAVEKGEAASKKLTELAGIEEQTMRFVVAGVEVKGQVRFSPVFTLRAEARMLIWTVIDYGYMVVG